MLLRARTAVIGATVMLALTGCTLSPMPTPSPTPRQQSRTSPASSEHSPSPTPTRTQGQQGAADAAIRFFRVQNDVASNDAVPIDALNEVAAGDLLAGSLAHFQESRLDGRRQIGEAVPSVKAVTGDNPPFIVDICLDSTKVTVVDATGRSVGREGSPKIVLHRLTVTEVEEKVVATADDEVQVGC